MQVVPMSSSDSSDCDDMPSRVERRDRRREMIMNYFRRVRPRNEAEIEPIREVSNPFVRTSLNPFSRSSRDPFYSATSNPFSSFDSSIYFVVKKVALSIAEENRVEFDLNAGDKKHTLVKRFIVYIFNLANKALD
jgi:hypothetical protein